MLLSTTDKKHLAREGEHELPNSYKDAHEKGYQEITCLGSSTKLLFKTTSNTVEQILSYTDRLIEHNLNNFQILTTCFQKNVYIYLQDYLQQSLFKVSRGTVHALNEK